jgi:prepilin-type N-terminal cleavage/methylation domain-containing protein
MDSESKINQYTQNAHKTKCRPKGFTLLELLIALVITSISFMAILPLLWNTIHVNKSMSTGAKAKDIAVQKVEELMSLPSDSFYDSTVGYLKNGGTSYTSAAESLSMNGVVPSASDPAVFTRTFRIDKVPVAPGISQPDPQPVILTAVVQYTYKGQAKSRSFSTLWSF